MDCSHLYPSQDRLSGTGIDHFKEHVSSTGILTERERGGSDTCVCVYGRSLWRYCCMPLCPVARSLRSVKVSYRENERARALYYLSLSPSLPDPPPSPFTHPGPKCVNISIVPLASITSPMLTHTLDHTGLAFTALYAAMIVRA